MGFFSLSNEKALRERYYYSFILQVSKLRLGEGKGHLPQTRRTGVSGPREACVVGTLLGVTSQWLSIY